MGNHVFAAPFLFARNEGDRMAPVSGYFNGHGDEVMADMKRQYKDPAKAKQVFYATANAHKASAARTRRMPQPPKPAK